MRPSPSFSALSVLAAAATIAACSDSKGLDQVTAPRLTASAPSTDLTASGSGPLVSALDSETCADVGGGALAQGTGIVLWRCESSEAQIWTYTASKEFRIKGGTLCLDAFGGRGENGDRVVPWACHGGANQKWERTAAGELRGINGKCLDVAGGEPNIGTKIVIWDCHGGPNQKWTSPAAVSASTAPTTSTGSTGGGTTGGTATPSAPAPAPAPAEPAPPAPAGNPTDGASKVFAFVGAVPSIGAVEGMGGSFAKYEQDFRAYADRHWATEGASWDQANYYDRAMIYYVWWARTGNATYLDRANALVLNYRKNYVEASNYNASPHWAMLDGLALHYLLTGDEASRRAVGWMTDKFAYPYYVQNLGRTSAEMENRIQARVLLGFVVANYIKAPSREGNDWAVRARDALTRILASQSPDGAYRFTQANQCGYNKPFMVGMLNDSMIRYYTLFERDGRILPSIKKAVDYIWANDWRSAERAVVYLAGPCNGGPVGTAVDLNNLIVSGFGFVYEQTRDATYRDRGDAMFAGAVAGNWLPGSKQFNQQYTSSYRYLSLRQ